MAEETIKPGILVRWLGPTVYAVKPDPNVIHRVLQFYTDYKDDKTGTTRRSYVLTDDISQANWDKVIRKGGGYGSSAGRYSIGLEGEMQPCGTNEDYLQTLNSMEDF